MPTAAEARAELERRRAQRGRGTGAPRRRLGSRDQSAVSRLIEQDIPLDELEDDELRFANTRADAEEAATRAQMQRDADDRSTMLGLGTIARPFTDMATDPTKRRRIGENLSEFGENLGDLGRDAMRAMPTGFPSQEEWQEGLRLAGEDFSGAQAGAQRAAQAAPGQVSRAAQAAPGALRLGGERLMANVMADPIGRELAAVAPLGPFAPAALPFLPNTRDAMRETAVQALGVAGEIGRAVTYGPWEDERQLQYELDAARFMEETGFGDPEQTRELADEGLRQAGWAGLNLAFAPLDVPVVARGAGAVASRLGGRQAAEAAVEAPMRGRRLGEPAPRVGDAELPVAAAPPLGNGPRVRPRTVVDAPNGSEVIVNPTHADLMRMTRRVSGRDATASLRYLQDADGNIYVGPAFNFTHDDIVTALARRNIEVPGYAPDRFDHGGVISGFIDRVGDELRGVPPRSAPQVPPPINAGDPLEGVGIGSAADDAGSSTGAQEEWIDAYRGIEEPFDGTFRVGERNWYPNTVSASRTPDAANFYARKTTGMAFGEGANVMPVQARGPFVPREEFERLTYEYMGRGRWSAEKEQAATIRAVDELRRRGYRGITSDVDDEIAVFADEGGGVSNIRSRFDDASRAPEGSAATDPLGGISTEGARLGDDLPGAGGPARQFDGGPIGGDYWRREVSLQLGDDSGGRLSYRVLPDRETWQIHTASVRPELQGRGHGVAMYEELIRRAREAGVRRIISDREVSAGAENVYQALRRRGYDVQDLPNGRHEIRVADAPASSADPLGGVSAARSRDGSSLATTAAIGGTALGGAMLAGDEAEAEENAELGAAQAEFDRLEALLRAAPANTRDMPAVETYQDALKREGYYGQGFSPDGDWGDGTDAAVEALRGDISAARERVEELELAERSAAAAPSDIEQAWRQWGPLAAFGGGVALAEVAPWGLGRLSATRGVRRRLEARNARADTLVNPEPLTQPGRSRASQIEANEEAATRAENINDFWRQGGAGERVPFRTTRSGSQRGFTVNRDAADMSELFPPDGASRWRLPDLGYAALGGVEALALHPFVEDARAELEAAQAAIDAKVAADEDPTLAELQRLEAAKNAFANTEALQRLGQGFAAGRLLAPTIHRYPNPQPNLAAAGAERTRLNQYLAPRRKPKK